METNTNHSPFTSKGYRFSKNWSSYNTYDIGRAFFSDGYVKRLHGLEVFDHVFIFNNPVLKNEPLFYKKRQIPITIYSANQEEEVIHKYNMLEIDYDEIAIFFFKHNNSVKAKINLGDSLLKLSNFETEDQMESKTFDFSFEEFQSLSNNLSAKSVLALFNKDNFLFKEDVENVTGLFDKPNYQEILETFRELEDDFGAGYINDENNPHAQAHGDIEMKALFESKVIDNIKNISKIYYGNWLRDFSQLIVGATIGLSEKDKLKTKQKMYKSKENAEFFNKMKDKFSHDTWVKIVELLAVHEFIYSKDKNKRENYIDLRNEFVKEYGELTKDVLGIYRPEEHIDNPKGLKDESKIASFNYELPNGKKIVRTLYNGENETSLTIKNNMKFYIMNDLDENKPSSFTYFSEQLKLAKINGRNRDGFRHFGAALHVLEDYFAHSNFVEISLIKKGFTKVYPWVQMDSEYNKIKDAKSKAKKIPIVTGLFSTDDTISSIAPKIGNILFPKNIEKYKTRQKGDRTFFDTLIIYILEDLSQKQKSIYNKTKHAGFTYEELLVLYKKYLKFIDKLAELENGGLKGWFIKAPKIVIHYISQILKFFPDVAFNIVLNATDDAIKETQTIVKSYGTNPSHTQIAKDPDDHPLNELAAFFAIYAVENLGREMIQVWNGTRNIDNVINQIKMNYFTHPSNVEWTNKQIEKWIEKDKVFASKNIKRAESATFSEHVKKLVEKDLSKYNLKIKYIYDYFKTLVN